MKVFEWEIAFIKMLQQHRDYALLETIMRGLSNANLGIGIGIVAFIYFTRKMNWKFKGYYLFCIGLCILIADPLSHRLVKVLVARPRPFYLLSGCDSRFCWGFVSSHATNFAALGTFLCCWDKRNIYFFLPLFVLISFSRLYLNKHFPLDVIGGGLLGMLIGTFIFYLSQAGLKKMKAMEVQ